MSNASVVVCAHCGRPMGAGQIWLGGRGYHFECTQSPYKTQPLPAPLTETEVRRIVREELAKATKEQP